ncbi:O-antigen ligase family protein [Lactonifactor longoviformis]|uniref:O-antigen ligase family protein n=1 Tax=Lactonifactor longoviformis TaxID=341220 RepID=UPI0036F33DCA
MINKLKGYVKEPFYALLFMLLVVYVGAPPFLREYTGVFRKLALVWACILLAVYFCKNYRNYLNKYSGLLFLLCVSYGITILVNYHNKLSSNIFSYAYFLVTLLLFFNVFQHRDKITSQKYISIFMKLNVFATFVFAVIALVMFCFNIVGFYETDTGIQHYGLYENRLWGLFNPNIGGMNALIAIAFSLFLYKQNKKKFYVVSIVIEYIYLILTQSRSALLSFFAFIIIFIVFVLIGKEKFFVKGKKPFLFNIGKLVCIVAILLVSVPIVKNVVVIIPNTYIALNNSDSQKQKEEDVRVKLARIENFEEDNADNLSNGRIGIWKAGVKVWKTSPIFGVGLHNVYEDVKGYLDKGTAQAVRNGSMHNVYITTLVSSGVMGAAVFLIFLVIVVWSFIKYLFTGQNTEKKILMGLIFALMLGDCLESRIIFSTSNICFIFWTICGYLIFYEGEEHVSV